MFCAEGSHSGRVHHLGKVAYGKPYQEFESPSLRTKQYKILTPGLVHRLGKAASRKGPGVRISSPPLLIQSMYKLGTECTIF